MATYTYIENSGNVKDDLRLSLRDTDVSDGATTAIFSDGEYEAFYRIEGNNLKRATAHALETIATDEALRLKVVRALDFATDGAKLMDSLMKRAKELRTQADADDARAQDLAGDGFQVAEQVYTDFGYRERLMNEILREG